MSDVEFEVRLAWQRHVGRGGTADRWFESVAARYRERHRHYHDLRHLRWVIRHVERLADDHPADDLTAVVVAGCFHDAVYATDASDNEIVSARLARTALVDLGWHDDRIEQVASMIEGTSHHDHAEADRDHQLLYAADLAVLAAEPAGYTDYVRSIRREYGHVSDVDWVEGRSAVLERFLEREAIYAPALDLIEWERRARGNLTSELDGLRSA